MSDHEASKRGASVERRLQRVRKEGLAPGGLAPSDGEAPSDVIIECGWGRLALANTFDDPAHLADCLREERPDRRDIAFYVRDPHVLLAAAPQELFLDPSHTYRLTLATYRPARSRPMGFTVRRLSSRSDAEAVNVLYASRDMVAVPLDFFWSQRDPRVNVLLVAEDDETGEIVGTVTGVDPRTSGGGSNMEATSLWCLAVSPQARRPGIGEALVRRLAEHFKARGAAYLDLSVMHDNEQAIALYEKLGFERVPFFTVKNKNTINEALYAGPATDEQLNPYASIIVDEARRRGIHAEITDAPGGFFRLSYGGRSVHCRESLSEFTSGVAVSICDDKSVTRRVVERVGINCPKQLTAGDPDALTEFLEAHEQVVVKPARGEQGRGISIGLTEREDVDKAIEVARQFSSEVLIEECIEGDDLRLVVIDYRVVATAIRKPAHIVGDGRNSIEELIRVQSRRRAAATGGESRIPMDSETERCVIKAGYKFEDVPDAGVEIAVRRTANLHTGGTIHDVTGVTHNALIDAAITAARAIEIPVTGVDLMVKSPRKRDYWFLEANERPGLANHEPQPTAERFVDFLFPLSVPQAARTAQRRLLTRDAR